VSSSPKCNSHLLFVDDDDDYREVVSSELMDHGFSVTNLTDGPAVIDYFKREQTADVLILDWNLPSIAGIDLVPQLRRGGIVIPVIILTGMAGADREVEALDRGAIDFVDKSRGVPVLAKRIHLILKTKLLPRESSENMDFERGPLQLRTSLCRAFWRGQDLNLTISEFNIVYKLATCAGDHLSYRAIYDCVHHCGFIAGSGEDGYRTNVRSSIKRIRNKFRSVDARFDGIENFQGFGYRWKTGTQT
jgi:two-component system response regulator ChvI